MNQIDNGYRRDFNMNEMHMEPPFLCDYATSRNGCYDINGQKVNKFLNQTALKWRWMNVQCNLSF